MTLYNFIRPSSRVALQLDNSSLWLKLDKILTNNNAVIIPVPHFFTSQQIQHMVVAAGIDTVICHQDTQDFWLEQGFCFSSLLSNGLILLEKTIKDYPPLPKGTHKITFTSGTTNEPKGVCLSLKHLEKVGQSLAEVTKGFNVKKHLCLLPLSVLLENMAANYAAKNSDITIITPSLAEMGLTGSSSLDVMKLIEALKKYQPDSIILMPQILKAIVYVCENHEIKLPFLKFIAVGGAVCSKGLLSKARKLNLPVYEGYGISECGSVISLNTSEKSDGSVGKILPHQQITLASDGEIIAKGELFLGYLGQKSSQSNQFATGDIGRFDEDNNLHIIGRKKNIIINSYGRNISPDWIEAELLSLDEILQVAIYGEAKPFLTAICVSKHPKEALNKAINTLNKSLPDYAQIKAIIMAKQPFSIQNQMLTASGKTKHPNIFKHNKTQLEKVYESTS
jgi:long-subunit acyl-CoA synthetase (AMP-forming)